MAPATGVVSRLDVSEGQRVKAGQMLAVVTVPRAAYLIFPGCLEIAILRRINSG
ncbi:biotin/lipoyl-binding protein [Xanthomonas albilineans]